MTIKGKKIKIGIFGGTFDPIHYGHLIAAQNALERLGLTKLIFIPAGKPPHKCNWIISPPQVRYKMVKLGILGNKYFVASDVELSSDCTSYTVDSLKKTRKLFTKAELYLLIGLDQALTLSTWKDPDGIFKICKVVVLARPGYKATDIESKWRKKVSILPIPLIEISASDIRARVLRGASLEYLVPGKVRQFIEKHGLYKDK